MPRTNFLITIMLLEAHKYIKPHLEVQGEVILVGVPEAEGQEEDLEVDLGEDQEDGLVGVLEVKVSVKALGVLAFQVVSGMEEPLKREQ